MNQSGHERQIKHILQVCEHDIVLGERFVLPSKVLSEQTIRFFGFARIDALALRIDELVLGLAKHRRALQFKDLTVRTVQNRVVLHRQPPAQRIHRRRVLLEGQRQQIEEAGNIGSRYSQPVDPDQLHAIVGFGNHACHPRIRRNALDDHILQAQQFLEFADTRTDGRRSYGLAIRSFHEFMDPFQPVLSADRWNM